MAVSPSGSPTPPGVGSVLSQFTTARAWATTNTPAVRSTAPRGIP
jgi:hypothetical protein